MVLLPKEVPFALKSQWVLRAVLIPQLNLSELLVFFADREKVAAVPEAEAVPLLGGGPGAPEVLAQLRTSLLPGDVRPKQEVHVLTGQAAVSCMDGWVN